MGGLNGLGVKVTALAEKIYNEVLDLPTDERLSLLDKILHIITIPAPAESHKRLADIRSGKEKTIPGESVFLEVQERFQK